MSELNRDSGARTLTSEQLDKLFTARPCAACSKRTPPMSTL